MANTIIVKRSSVAGKVPLATDLQVGELAVNLADQKIYSKNASGTVVQLGGGSGSGDVVGPASATDNALVRFDGTTGKLVQNSQGILDDSGNLDITSAKADYFDLDVAAAAPASAVGREAWDDGAGTSILGLKGGVVTYYYGQQTFARVYNGSGAAMSKGQVVYIVGAQGNRIDVRLAKADAESTSANTIGLVAEPIANGEEGWVQTSGPMPKLVTTGLTAGAAIYLSPTTAGAYTTTKPTAPNHLVVLGFVERVDATVGSIFIKVDNGYELDELHNVNITSPTSGNTLIYDATAGYWKNANLTAGTGISVTNGAGSITIANSAPDQTVALTGSGATTVTGTYPNFTIFSTNTTYSPATSTVAGLIELASDTAQSTAANAVTSTASRTYGLQVNASGQGVVNVPWTDTVYSLPTATTTVLGGVKLGSDTAQSTAANAVTTTASRSYALQVNASGQGVINVPWTDTVYTLPSATTTVLGGIKLGSDTAQTVAANTVTATASRTYAIQVNASSQALVNVPWTDTTYSQATSAALGLIKLGSDTAQTVAANAVTATASRSYAVQVNASSQALVNVPWTDTTYSQATSAALGLIKLGSDTAQTVAANAVTATASRSYAVQVNASGQALVNVPWTDTNSGGTVTSVSGTGSYGGLTLSGTVTTSGSLTLSGTPTGTWPISVSGSSASATTATTATNQSGGTVNATSVLSSAGVSDAYSGLRVVNPGGGALINSSGTVTGAIKIKLPVASLNSATMIRLTVKIYEYSTGYSRTFEIGGYNYSAGNWYNWFATQSSQSGGDMNVRFGQDATSDCIWIGETSSSWSYPQVFITDVQCGYSNTSQAMWASGWAVSFVTAFDTVEQSTVAYRPLSSGNYNSYAPSLTGIGASGTWGINITGNSGNVTGTVAVANGGTGATTAAGALTNLGAYAASNPSGYTSNTGTVTSVGGTGTVSGLTLSGTVTTSGSLTLGGTLSASISNISDAYRWWNNFGDNHGTRTSFDAQGTASTVNFGWRYVQGSTNGPGISNATQYYSQFVGLGNDYSYSQYGMQTAVPRTPLGGLPYMCVRFEEAGAFGAWQKIYAGYADTAGSASNVTGTVAIANGGTGATTAAGALTNLGAYAASNPNGYTSNTGTVTSVGGTGTVAGISLSGTVTTSGNLTLGGTFALPSGQVPGKMVYNTFTATASQTVFTTSATYTSGKIEVFVNGVKVRNGTDVTVTAGTSVTMAAGLPVGTLVDLVYPI